MLIFKTVRWKNFLSTGNTFTEIQLNRSPTTLIVGTNGTGKSTLLDALSFALFGKAHRNINKPQLVNSVNGKNCIVECEFDVGKHQFKIVRAIKPGKFEIWQNGQMINQDAKSRDYQSFLETNILKLNHKSFHQIVVLGSSSFIPFMQLPSNQRREVIEDLLDINVFSKMNGILKEYVQSTKEQSKNTQYQIDLTKEKIELQKKYIKDINQLNEEQRRKHQEQIKTISKDIDELQNQNVSITSEVGNSQDEFQKEQKALREEQSQLKLFEQQFQTKVKNVVSEAQFFENNQHCPTCDQDIDDQLRTTKINEAKDKAKEISDGIQGVSVELIRVNKSLLQCENSLSDIQSKLNVVFSNNQTIQSFQRQLEQLQKEISNLTDVGSDIDSAKKELEHLTTKKEDLTELKLSLSEKMTYYDTCSSMLKDTGIKTKIIRSYLPVMNQLINQYLQVLDFFVQFEIDEQFNETIRSRHRDTFSYSNFSEGEKSRIDLSLLFTWRQIAKMKNSISTNILILDETFDSSLDYDGIDNLLKILDTLDENSNVFIISHKGDILEGKFASKIEFKKDKNFSTIFMKNSV